MLEAAHRLFIDQGYAETTMAAIAEAGGVAVQTLYFTFHSKGALLGEVLGAAIVGFDRWVGPPLEPIDFGDPATLRRLHDWFVEFEAQADPRSALELFLDAVSDSLRRAAPLVPVMYAAATDPDARGLFELGERRRADSYGAIVRLLAKKGGLRAGLGAARATDLALVVAGPATYSGLAGRGWSHAECRRFMLEVLAQQLLRA
jgi:AcrR family transcriptional regulator